MRLVGLFLLTVACSPVSGSGDVDPAGTDTPSGHDGGDPGAGDGAGGDDGSEDTDGGSGEDTAAEDTGADDPADSGAADSGDPDTGSAPPALSHAQVVQPIWDRACVHCHDSGGDAGLSLVAENAYADLVGVPSTQADLPLVSPGDPEGSYLWHKLAGTQDLVGGGGSLMPEGMDLTSDELATIQRWIREGAAP